MDLPAKIGRGKGNVVFVQFGAQEISLDVTDQRVSRRHLEIVPVEDGIVLRDTSRNGTLVLVDGREERLPATAALATAPQRLRIGEMLIDLSPIGTEVRPVALQIVTPGGRESVVAIGQNGLVFGANGRKLSVVEAFDEHAVHLPDRVLFTI